MSVSRDLGESEDEGESGSVNVIRKELKDWKPCAERTTSMSTSIVKKRIGSPARSIFYRSISLF